jgi:hypothetical protein
VTEGNSDVQSMDQGLIFSTIVGGLVFDLQDVFQVITLRGDEEYTGTHSFEVQGTIKVHLLVLRLLLQWGWWVFVHSETKLARIWDLIAYRG